MIDINVTSETQGPESFTDFIEGKPDAAKSSRDDLIAAYSADVLQPNKIRLAAEYAGNTALSPLVQSMGRNDG